MATEGAAATIKALQIDPELAEAHATLGYVRHYEWQWRDAEKEFTRAIELNPGYAVGSRCCRPGRVFTNMTDALGGVPTTEVTD